MSGYWQLCSYFLVGKAQLANIQFYLAIAEVMLMESKLNNASCYKSAETEFLPCPLMAFILGPIRTAHAASCDSLP